MGRAGGRLETVRQGPGERPSKGIPEMTKEDKKHFLVNLSKDPGEKRNWAEGSPRRAQAPPGLGHLEKYQDDLASSAK